MMISSVRVPNLVVIPKLGFGIHEFLSAVLDPAEPNSWMPRPSLGMTID
jgi:hypothetical protein